MSVYLRVPSHACGLVVARCHDSQSALSLGLAMLPRPCGVNLILYETVRGLFLTHVSQ